MEKKKGLDHSEIRKSGMKEGLLLQHYKNENNYTGMEESLDKF